MELKNTTINSLAMGAINERLQEALDDVLANMADPDTDPTEQREINLKICIKPEKDRATAKFKITVRSKLASHQPHEGLLFIAKKQGKFVAFEQNPDQLQIFENSEIRK